MSRQNKQGFNTTQLDQDHYITKQVLHRDILAHHFRWTHIAKFWGHDKKFLDVGCGKGAPMCRALYANGRSPSLYVGVEYRESATEFNRETLKTNFETVFVTADAVNHPETIPVADYDIITCLEVIEHMADKDGLKLLDNLQALLKSSGPDAILFLSTPCYDGKTMADNHVYEWRYQELKDALEDRFNIDEHFGTFASQKDIVPVLSAEEKLVFDSLRCYYESNMLSIMFAPTHPAQSRNCIWRLSIKREA